MRLANYVEHYCKPRAVKMLSCRILICNGIPLGRRMRKRWRCSIRINSGLRGGKKDLSLLERELSLAPYAETHCPPQDEEGRRETV